jgi:hypothetical protein
MFTVYKYRVAYLRVLHCEQYHRVVGMSVVPQFQHARFACSTVYREFKPQDGGVIERSQTSVPSRVSRYGRLDSNSGKRGYWLAFGYLQSRVKRRTTKIEHKWSEDGG